MKLKDYLHAGENNERKRYRGRIASSGSCVSDLTSVASERSRRRKRKRGRKRESNSTVPGVEPPSIDTAAAGTCNRNHKDVDDSRSQNITFASKIKSLREILFHEKNRKQKKRDDVASMAKQRLSRSPSPSGTLSGTLKTTDSPGSLSSPDHEADDWDDSSPEVASSPPKLSLHFNEDELLSPRSRRVEMLLRSHEDSIRTSLRSLKTLDENLTLEMPDLDDAGCASNSTLPSRALPQRVPMRRASSESNLKGKRARAKVPDKESLDGAEAKKRSKKKKRKQNEKDGTFPCLMVRHLEWKIDGPGHTKGVYTGPAMHGVVPHGRGKLSFFSGDVYKGPFKMGKMHGPNASHKSAFGIKYKGDYRNNSWHGHGECTFPNGRRYIGNYEDGKQHGFGVEYNPDGSVFHLGQWHRGKPTKVKQRHKSTSGKQEKEVSSAGAQSSVESVESSTFPLQGQEVDEEDCVSTSTAESSSDEGVSIYATKYKISTRFVVLPIDPKLSA